VLHRRSDAGGVRECSASEERKTGTLVIMRSGSPFGTTKPTPALEFITVLKEATMASTVENKRETTNLIGSDKVDGTAVYGADERKIGNVQRVMIDKISGQVRYVVVSFGGFLGMGEDYYPMPWEKLDYDTRLGGYRVDLTEAQLKGAPKFTRNTDWDWSNQVRERTINDYYNTPL
jgi:hypothetical protein